MTTKNKDTHLIPQVKNYEIRIVGQLGTDWLEWFDGFSVTETPDGETILTGNVIDQAFLHSILKKIRDLGMPLISLNEIRSLHNTENNTQNNT